MHVINVFNDRITIHTVLGEELKKLLLLLYEDKNNESVAYIGRRDAS